MKLREETEYEKSLPQWQKAAFQSGMLKSQTTQQAARAAKIPEDSIVELEAAYYKGQPKRLWNRPSTLLMLKLLRDPGLSMPQIAHRMSETLGDARYNRNIIAARLRFLRRLLTHPENPRGYKRKGP